MKRLLHGMFVPACFGLLLALAPDKSLAGTKDETTDPATDLTTLSIEELMKIEVATVYSASKFEQKVTEAPSSVSIVTADEIKKYGYRTLADILRSLRSFYITYDRNYTYVGIRGFGRAGDYNSRILLLIDGHRINDNIYDSAPVGTEFPLDVELIDRVEVIRGPGSSLYGNNAFFAVINVLTKRGRDLAGVEVSAEAGSFGAYKGRVTYGNEFGNGLEAFLSGSSYDSKGDRLFFPEFNDPAHNNGITGHTDFDRSQSAFTRFSYGDFTLEGLYASRTKGIPTAAFGTDFNDPRNKTVDGWWFVDLKYDHYLQSDLNVMGRLFYDANDYSGDYLYSGVVNKDLSSGRWWGGELKIATTLLEKNKLIFGSEYRDNIRQDQKNYNEPFTPDPTNVDDQRNSRIWALYLQDEFTICKNLILNAGVRYDHYSTFGDTVNPRAALIYSPSEKSAFKLLYGSAFRAPNVFELYYQSTVANQLANPDLKPEKIKTYEMIYEQYFGSNLRGTVTGFYYTIDDLIALKTEPAGLAFKNVDKVKTRGAETELEGKWENGLTSRASYSYQDAIDNATDQPLRNSPRHLVKLNVNVPLLREKIFLGLEEQFTSKRKTLNDSFAKSFYVTNLTLFSQNLLKDLELSATAYNLFDCKYGNPGGEEHALAGMNIIQQDGRVFRIKLTYRF